MMVTREEALRLRRKMMAGKAWKALNRALYWIDKMLKEARD